GHFQLQPVEQGAVIGAAGTAEDHVALVAGQVVGKAQARLPGAGGGTAVVAGADVARDVDAAAGQAFGVAVPVGGARIGRMQRIDHRLRRGVVQVGGAFLV